MNDACQRFIEEPEAHAAHLAECAQCRALFEGLNATPEEAVASVEALPLAPWEGASYRAWPVVIGGGVLLVAIAVAVCVAAAMSPAGIIGASLASMDSTRVYVASAAASLRQAPVAWQLGFGVLFVIVNAALVLLLRRAPRGLDA